MLFSSPQHALRWAYETSDRPIIKGSSVNRMRGEEKPSSDEITCHDQHAQAALILGLCERVLPTLHMVYVEIQFGRDVHSIDLMERHLAASFGSGLHSRRAMRLIIRSYCGEKCGLREIRKALACGTLKAANLRNIGYDALDLIHAQAMERLDESMRGAGLIEQEPVSRLCC
jgi:hypothetical protein